MAVLLALFFRDQITSQLQQVGIIQEQQLSEEAQEVYDFVESCVETETENILSTIIAQGGYYEMPEIKIDYELVEIPYFYYQGKEVNTLTKEDIEKEFSEILPTKVIVCVNNFENYNYDIKYNDKYAESTILIYENNIDVELTMPIEINFEETSYDFKEFIYTTSTELLNMFELKNEIIDIQKESPNSVEVSKIIEAAETRNLHVELKRDENTMVYGIYSLDENNIPENYFNFGVEYEWIEE